MIDKSLVKKRFSKSLETYEENAIVQKRMAERLVDILPFKNFPSILEVGSATGILTREIIKKIKFDEYCANDIVEESEDYLKKILPSIEFKAGDIEKIELDKTYDLIVSNACLQWCSSIEKTIEKLLSHLNKDGVLAVSLFGKENLKEIRTIFDVPCRTVDISVLPKSTAVMEETVNMFFSSPIDVLKHLKYTGVNAIKEVKLTKTKLKEFEQAYLKFSTEKNRVQLTYNPVYLVIKK